MSYLERHTGIPGQSTTLQLFGKTFTFDLSSLLLGIGAGILSILAIEEITNRRFKGLILSPMKRLGGRGR